MTRRSSTFIQRTREQEAWLEKQSAVEGDASEAEGLVATAALARGVVESIPVPPEAEEYSRTRAVAMMSEQPPRGGGPQAPWYLRMGHAMRFVFGANRNRKP